MHTFVKLFRFQKTDRRLHRKSLPGTFLALLLLCFCSQNLFAETSRTLDFYLQQAEKNSPLINKTLNDNRVVALNLQEVKKILRDPQINLNAAVMLAPIISHDNGTQLQLASNNATKYNGYDLAITNGGQYQALLAVQQPLFTQPSYRAYEEKSNINQDINKNTIRLTRHDIQQLVSHQYLLCLNSAMQMETSNKLVNEIGNQLRIMTPLVANAIYKQTDEMLLQIEYKNYQDAYTAQRAAYVANLYDLNALCGIQDTSVVTLEPAHLVMNQLPTKQSYFLTAYKLDSMALLSDLKINNLKYLPQVNLFADGGLNASYLPTPNRLGISAGITFSWTLYDGHQRKIEQEKTHYGLENIAFDKHNFITQQDMNKSKIIHQINALNERIQNLDDQLNTYKKLVTAYELQLAHGNMSIMDYKNLLRDVAAKQQEATLAHIEKESLICSFNYWNY
ncbi:TolC family protein [Microbacter margulisiae]|uniref:Outer membrane protein TolC n=1 Tax=Microbacter margulisiae TaxID=1350067 RepID=A0A7W5H2N9_9PORP|nr:TolC family protein [Microbacter margulisiae]MBB3187577.1 outer membrane protein TolC [Microbacter margulisiae]